MSELCITPVFEKITCIVNCQPFSVGYFGRHCGRNLLLLQHDITLMLVFHDDEFCGFIPDFVKYVSSDGIAIKGVKVVGNENVILLLDDTGRLWNLINAFELSDVNEQRLYLLNDSCFYQWVPFKKFKSEKVLAISTWGHGFICMGIQKNSQRKLLFLPSVNSNVREYSFQEVTCCSSLNFHIINLKINTQNSINCDDKKLEEKLFINNRLTGKTYICSDNDYSLINYSNDILVSVLGFEQENSVLLCFQSGKLVCYFYNFSCDSVAHLPKELTLIEKCCCSDYCILWSEGITLNHTKLVFEKCCVKLVHLKLNFRIEKPQWLKKFDKCVMASTVNNIYYEIKAVSNLAEKIHTQPEELLSKICQGALNVHKLNSEIDAMTNFLHCKEILDKYDLKEKVQMSLDQNCLLLKFCLGVILSKDIWKIMLVSSVSGKNSVRMTDLDTDVMEGMPVRIDMPFKTRVKVSLVGSFHKENLIIHLGDIGEPEESVSHLIENIKKISLRKKKHFCLES